MKIWLALLAAPILALMDQVVSFATVHWACAHHQVTAIHAVHAFFLVAAVASTVPAFRVRRRATVGTNADESVARRLFLASVAVGVGALSIVIIASMWMPTWFIAPCFD